MSDVVTNTPSPPSDGVALPAGTPLPPPPPLSLNDDRNGRQRILAIIGGLALLAAVIMGLLWISARGDSDSATAERDAAQAATVAESDRTEEALVDLAIARTDLDAALATNERLTSEAQTAETAATDAVARADEADAAAEALEVQNDELATELATLQSTLVDAETAAVDADVAAQAAAAEAEAATAAAAVEAPAANSFDIAAAANFARFIGERLASVEGSSVLGQGQHTCLGTAVVNDIGLDAIGAGLESGASSSARGIVVDAIERGALSCGIDPSAIF